jgi:hypothetical protein
VRNCLKYIHFSVSARCSLYRDRATHQRHYRLVIWCHWFGNLWRMIPATKWEETSPWTCNVWLHTEEQQLNKWELQQKVRELQASCLPPPWLKGKKVKLSLCLTKYHAMKTCWGSGDTAPCILDLGIRWRWVVSFTPHPAALLLGKSPW